MGSGAVSAASAVPPGGASAGPPRPYRSALRSEVRFIAMWVALACVFGAATVVAFDPFRRATGLRALIGGLPTPLISFLGLGDLGSWSGFVDALLFGLFAPVAFLSFSIGFGTRAGVAGGHGLLAGAEAQTAALGPGTPPLAIVTTTLRRVAALVTGNLLLGIALFAGVLAAAVATHEPFDASHLASAVIADMALGLTFGVVGLVVAMLSGRVGLAAVIATVAALAADTLNGVAPAVPAFRSVRYVSLVYYAEAGRPLGRGVTLVHLAVLLAAVLTVIAVAAMAGTRTARGRAAGGSGARARRTPSVVPDLDA